MIAKYTMDQFIIARSAGKPVHDRTLRTWAISKAREMDLINFKASEKWLKNFKQKYGISSRKITKITTVNRQRDQEEIIDRSLEFIFEFNEQILPIYLPNQILNTDQSGFRYVHFGNRTLSKIGEKDTTLVVNDLDSTTHSYTIQPIITMAGKVLSPVLINFKEVTGNEFGLRVAKTIPNLPNLYVTCSRAVN